ncbi:MAG TPA: acyl-CoA thioesterase [Opitutaceae bacterium]|nr:acyl-CoA thioesterase [Opitutaceae bacterium]
MTNLHARFETEMLVRPDDIDLFQHVHSSRYMDYVLAARYDQMARCYGLSWEAFIERGLGWYMTAITMNYLRPLGLGDHFVVRTWIEDFLSGGDGVRVRFEIERQPTAKRCVDGHAEYKLVDLTTNRAVPIPADVRAKYSI